MYDPERSLGRDQAVALAQVAVERALAWFRLLIQLGDVVCGALLQTQVLACCM
jgi:hypothetical protein